MESVACLINISDSLITKSIGREVAFEALPAVERAPLMAWIEDLRSENERRHLRYQPVRTAYRAPYPSCGYASRHKSKAAWERETQE